jgi:hypothetical protein
MSIKPSTEGSHPTHEVREIARQPHEAQPQLLDFFNGHGPRHLLLPVALVTSLMRHGRAPMAPCNGSATAVQYVRRAGSL